jgi:TRAP-type mannitol/chloroaromatic compound transport system permease small subunit
MAFRKLYAALEWLSNQLGWLAGGLTAVMMIAVVREVIGRYLFHNPSDWSLELCGYLLVGLSYLGAAFTEVQEGHIRIDFLYERLRGKKKTLADIIIPFIGLCWGLILVWQGSRVAFHSLSIGARSSDAMMWPLFPSQIMVPIGSALLCLVLIAKIIRNIIHLTRGNE